MHKKSPINFIPTLDAATYSDPSHYQRELDTIFYSEWIYALHESQIPALGSYTTLDIGDKPLLMVRGQDNIIRCFYNVCVHRGHVLAKGEGTTTRFTCPYHAWTYDCAGQLYRMGACSHTDIPIGNEF